MGIGKSNEKRRQAKDRIYDSQRPFSIPGHAIWPLKCARSLPETNGPCSKGPTMGKCLVYLDDIVSFGKTFDETLSNLRCVMERLKTAGLKLKASKCQWF